MSTLSRPSIDNDEAYTVVLARHGFWPMLRLFRTEANGLLYPLVYWPIARFGEGATPVRILALIAGVAAIPVVYLVGREFAGRRVALAGAALIAVNPNAVALSQYGRAYSFALVLGTVSYLALLRARGGARGAWVAYAIATALAGYAQILALLLLPLGQVVTVMASGKRFAFAWLRALGATAILAVPIAALAVSEATRRNPVGWLAPPRLAAAVGFLASFTVGRLEYHVAADGSTHLLKPVVLVPLVWVVVIAAGFWRSRRLVSHRWATDPLVGLLAWTAIPPLALFAISQVKPVFYPDTYLATSLPGACLLVVAAADRLATIWLRASVAAVIAGSFLAAAWATTHPNVTDNRGVGRWLAANRASSTPLVLDPLEGVIPLGYYDPSLRTRSGRIDVPEWHEAGLPAGVSGYEVRGSYSPGTLAPPTKRTLSPILKASRDHSLVMVVELGVIPEVDGLESPGVHWLETICETRRLVYTGITILVASNCNNDEPTPLS